MAIEQGELYYYDFGAYVDHLQGGRRPVIIVQSNALNRNRRYSNVLVVPVTTRARDIATFIPIEPAPHNGLTSLSYAIANHIATVSQRQLEAQLGHISQKELLAVQHGLVLALSLP